MWNDFFAQRDLFNQDGCIHVEGFLKAAESYCSWKDVENSIHRDDVFWELIAEDGNKKELGMYKPYWSPVPCQEKEVIYEHVRDGGGCVGSVGIQKDPVCQSQNRRTCPYTVSYTHLTLPTKA